LEVVIGRRVARRVTKRPGYRPAVLTANWKAMSWCEGGRCALAIIPSQRKTLTMRSARQSAVARWRP